MQAINIPGEDSTQSLSDESLLTRIANHRDRAAFGALFSRFSRRIFGLGMRLSGNEQLSKDLVQEVMLAVWQHSSRFNSDKGTAQSWIFALSRNKCIDILRKSNKHSISVSADQVWPDKLVETELVDETVDIEKLNIMKFEVERVKNLCGLLPVLQKKAIEIVYLHEVTHEDAAREFDIPLGTFKSRLRLGLIKLRELLKEK